MAKVAAAFLSDSLGGSPPGPRSTGLIAAGIELDGSLAMYTRPLDLERLLAE